MATLTSTIATSAAWPAGSWTEQPLLRVDSLLLKVFPAVAEATASQHYGYIATAGAGGAAVAPVDLAGQFCRITVTDGSTTQTWYGYCPSGVDAVNKTHANPVTGLGSVPSGVMSWTIYGLEYFLRSMTYDRCTTTDGTIKTVLPFNWRKGRGGRLMGNRAAAPVSGSLYTFDPSASASSWTARQAVEHILETFRTVSGITFTLAGQTTELDAVAGAWDMPDGQSYADAIRRVVQPELGWAIVGNGATLTVVSISDAAIGGLPANPNVVTLDLESSGAMTTPRVTVLDQAHYDTITVRGEPLRVCLTLSLADSSLEADWDTALATDYAAETTDEGRRKDKYRTLWARFSIPDAWANTVGIGGAARVAFPAIDPTTGLVSGLVPQVLWLPGLALDRTLPWLDTADTQPGEPLVTVTHPTTGSTLRLDDLPADAPGATVAVSDDRPGILLRPSYRHLLARGIYSGSGVDAKHPAAYAYSTLKATVSAYTFDRTRVTVSAVTAEPGQISREKIIDIPDCHLWIILAGTQTDIGVTEAADRYLRNDTAVLVQAAALARAWYGRPRASISCTYATPLILDRLGHVVSDVRSAGAIQQAGTMLTEISYSLSGQQSVSFRTELFDLRFDSMFSGRAGAIAQQRKIARVEETLANMPVRFAMAGAGASADVALLRITGLHADSPESGVRMYRGNLYANGSEATATTTGVTVRIPDIAADVELPSIGPWTDVPACCGIRTTQTWTGATETHSNDTVYEAVGILLVL